ncbi:MAG: flagellar basal body rod protein FlgB [Clostridiales bacterium]|nr:flagellar basal body rod protein FlgB [Clostridiales bacterium]
MFELRNSSLMEKTLDALWLRQKVISNNIANVDTPEFKSSKVIFEELLDEAMLETSDIKKTNVPDAKVVRTKDISIREDGNNVDIDKENLELYRVQIQYEYMVRKISDQFSNIKTVLKEGR